jgi:coproporphyrinogen III oxidase/REP element-mobilizing transposase RayT
MTQAILEKDHYYHVYNRGINSNLVFKNDENKQYFLKLMDKYLSTKIVVLAYCLMDNHYHFVVRILDNEKDVTQAFSNLFNAYTKAFNKQESRTGGLFERPFKRKHIKDETYLKNLIVYTHTNPENHGITDDFSTFQFSSYSYFQTGIELNRVQIEKEEVLSLFEDFKNMDYVHKSNIGSENKSQDLDLSGYENQPGLSGENPVPFDNQIKDRFYLYIQKLQDTITSRLEELDGKAKFGQDLWERPEGGGGRTRVIENGNVFEKGGVNISAVHGALPESMQNYFGVADADFFACGLSLVLHPKSPMVPTVHANWRYFEMYDKSGAIVDQWFGGGQDLTPYYLFDEDASHFHSICKISCDRHNQDFYPNYKKKCDDYFWNTHRNEARGIGGLFFDYCKATEDMKMQDWYNFVTQVGNSFLDAYIPIALKRKDLEYSQKQRDWQEIRRGRYVEFNLVHDKGTLFGLRTNGRIESILMSLPPHVQWHYDHHPEEGSEEERLIEILKSPKDWI